MKPAHRERILRDYRFFCTNQKFITSAIAKQQLDAFDDSVISIDKYVDLYGDIEMSTPFLKLMFKPTNLVKFCNLLTKADFSKEGQTYIVLLLVGFYSRYFYSMNSLKNKFEKGMNITTDDMNLLGFGKPNLNKISDLSKYIEMSREDFNALTFDDKQLAYLKASAMKVCRLGGGILE